MLKEWYNKTSQKLELILITPKDPESATPYNWKKKSFHRSWYLKWPAWAHGFNPKISIKKCAPGPEILAKMSKIMQVWFGSLIFSTFWLISQDSMYIFQTRFLGWNRELKLVVLSTVNPINKANFFSVIKGVANV